MKYFEVVFKVVPYNEDANDVLSALLAEVGFEAFSPTEKGLKGYIQKSLWDEHAVQTVISDFPFPGISISMIVTEAADEDWNEQWETEGFEPVIVDSIVCVHDTKNVNIPRCQYDILINPRLAFGTGTHPTTRMILKHLTTLPLEGKRVIDAGCGTGVLGILAAKCGATEVLGYDIDEWSVDNSLVNYHLNSINNAFAVLGDSAVLCDKADFDLLIANINRNILMGDMKRFSATLKLENSILLLSGFYTEDIPYLVNSANKCGFDLFSQHETDGWAMLEFRR